MTLDGFLTFLTIILAAYAVMPSVHRLRIELRLEWLIVLSAACFLLVICSEFSAPISQLCSFNDTKACWVFHLVYNSGWVGKEQAAFLVVVTWLFMAGILVVRKKLSAKSLPALSRLVSELAYQQKYSELVDLLEPQLSLINAGANRLVWQAKLFDRVENSIRIISLIGGGRGRRLQLGQLEVHVESSASLWLFVFDSHITFGKSNGASSGRNIPSTISVSRSDRLYCCPSP